MSVGSAFDAYVKNYLATELGMPEATGCLELGYLLEQQVEEGNREWATAAGADCFNQYKKLGACAELMKEMIAGSGHCFESTRSARVDGAVPLMGKPDLYYYNAVGDLVIIDWKVNGYCSRSGASPRKGYVRLLASGKPQVCHPKAQCMMINGISLNVAEGLELCDLSWARQLCIYGWVLGSVSIVAGIDQLACKPVDGAVGIRVASLRGKLSSAFQAEFWAHCCDIWARIQSGRVFDQDNDVTIRRLDLEADAYGKDTGNGHEDFFTSINRTHKW